ncbi:peroxide stress protein YaaA [Robiginitalea sp. SC105]|uniref:peroxide stress protein YaaA n=1 Tax=Robiginitalea sp. SC105 TaxID=2762332 RepID=UPI001639A800|nr:peroxide stress protein YaaA [Robiginitalea sp. SC105]MBC2839108.1 peroxide stress protein YaaA [Robiginitalea sp. SC105]
MKIVISPAKSLDYERELPTQRHSQPQFQKEAGQLNKILAKKKPRSLEKLMDISTELAELNWTRNQEFSLPFTPENARPAIFAFNGDVYQGLDAYSLEPGQLDALQEKVRILSGLYGMLRPLDLMQPYRLEMGTQLRVGRKKNLYEFWKKTLTARLNEELAEGEALVNLASKEYFSALNAKELKAPVITPVFKDWSKDKLRIISFFAKKARGSMVRYILDKGIDRPDGLLGFDYDDYQYSREHTLREDQPVFVR